MKSSVIASAKPVPDDDHSYPRLWRHKSQGTVWLEAEPGMAVVLSDGGDDELTEGVVSNSNFPDYMYERIRGSITIRFDA